MKRRPSHRSVGSLLFRARALPALAFLLLVALVAPPPGAHALQALQALQAPGSDTPLVLTGATLIDGTGAPPLSGSVVVVVDGRIECVGRAADCPTPRGAEVVRLQGRWIIPGLVDAHVHFSQTGWADGRPDALDLRADHPYDRTIGELRNDPERFFRSYLCAGVTAVFDVGGFPWSWELRRRVQNAPTLAPNVAAAGPLLSTRDHWLNLPGERQFLFMSDRDAVRAATGYLATAGTDAIKVWYLGTPDPEQAARNREYLAMAGERARREGIPLIVHATSLDGAKDALRAGTHLLVHSVENAEVDEEFLRLARRVGTFYTPTLSVYEGYEELRNRRFDEGRTDVACTDPATLERVRSTRFLPGAPSLQDQARLREQNRARAARMAENLRRVHAAGIPVAMGTDAGNPLTLHGGSVYREMEAMVEAGLTPMEVIVASTLNGARAMRRDVEFGSVEAGKVADLVILRSDPLADIRALRTVEWVVRAGALHRRADLQYHPPR